MVWIRETEAAWVRTGTGRAVAPYAYPGHPPGVAGEADDPYARTDTHVPQAQHPVAKTCLQQRTAEGLERDPGRRAR